LSNDPVQFQNVQKQWDRRAHFFAAAAEAMRWILVEEARRKKRVKHGGGRLRVELEAVGFLAKEPSEDLEALDEALTRLAAEDPAKAELVKLRFFAGLTMPEIPPSARDLAGNRLAPLDLRPHLALCRAQGSGQFRKSSRKSQNGMRGFARVCRIDDNKEFFAILHQDRSPICSPARPRARREQPQYRRRHRLFASGRGNAAAALDLDKSAASKRYTRVLERLKEILAALPGESRED
jgi:hypothetical protein